MRLDPALYERKRVQQGYSAGEFAAYVGVLCLADAQPERGRFRDERVLRAMLGQDGRHVPALLSRGDLAELPDGRLYVAGWDQWQEGDMTVKDRMARMRAAKRNTDRNNCYGGDRNNDRNGDRNIPSRLAHAQPVRESRPVLSSLNDDERDGTGQDRTSALEISEFTTGARPVGPGSTSGRTGR